MKTFALAFLLIPFFSFAQKENISLIDSLKFVDQIPHCLAPRDELPDTNSIFWRIVKLRESAIPGLIDKIDDTTGTTVFVRHFAGYYTVGDVAFRALEEIIHGIPTFELLGTTFDQEGCGYCSYWYWLRADIKHRQQFKANLQEWYVKNKSQMIWVNYKWSGEECFYHNPNNGYFEIKK